jgi:hypothetical protein
MSQLKTSRIQIEIKDLAVPSRPGRRTAVRSGSAVDGDDGSD